MRKKCCVIAVLVLLFVVGVLCTTIRFPFLCGLELPVSDEEAIRSQAKGMYSKRLPLIPVLIRIADCSAESVYYTIYYFPFGSVGMSYHCRDGYNIEKPLLRM